MTAIDRERRRLRTSILQLLLVGNAAGLLGQLWVAAVCLLLVSGLAWVDVEFGRRRLR